MTLDEFNDLRLRDISTLLNEEKAMLKMIRESVPMPDTNTMMQKVIPASDIEKYLEGTYTQVGGYVTRLEDVSHLSTYGEIYDSLRLDYLGTIYKVESDSYLGVIRFKTLEVEMIEIPYGVDFGGIVKEASPFTGNGFTKAMNGNIIPEYKCNGYLNIYDGAELYEVTKEGKEILRAVYDMNLKRFISVN